MSLDLDTVVEVVLQTVLEGDTFVHFSFLRKSDFQQALVHEFMVVLLVLSTGVVDVHFQSQQRQIQGASDEGKGFRRILLAHQGSFLPATLGQSFLEMLGEVHPDEPARSQEVDPQAQDSSELLPRFVVELVIQHGLEAIQAGEHGEQEGVEVTGDHVPVNGTEHGDVGVELFELALEGFIGENKQVVGFV